MIKLGIVGTSSISKQMIKAVQQHEGIVLQAIISRSSQKGREFQKEFDISDHAIDISQAKNVDAFYIASPNALHYEQAKKALLAHKHVLLEKPFTLTTKELEELFEIAKAKDLILMEAIKTLYLPAFKQLKNMINLSTIQYVEINFCKRSDRYDLVLQGEEPNIFSLTMGGGSLVDLGVYGVWVALELFGIPIIYTATGEIITTGVDGAGEIILKYPNFIAKIRHSKTVSQGSHMLIVQGGKEILIPHFSEMKEFLTEDYHCFDNEIHPMYYELDHFYQSILHKQTNDVFYKQSKNVLGIVEGCRHQLKIVYPADNKK